MDNLPKILRPPKNDDVNFIYNSWLKSYADNNYFNPIKGPAYYGYQKLLINKLLNQSIISIVCNPEDEDQIFGYAVYEIDNSKLILHWIYIKYNFRRLGVCRFLLDTILSARMDRNFFLTFKGTYYNSYAHKFDHTYSPKLAFTDKSTKPIGDK